MKTIKNIARKIRDFSRSKNPLLLSKYDRFFISPVINEAKLDKNFCSLADADIIILISARNNYQFLVDFQLKILCSHFEDCGFIVVDDGSTQSEREIFYPFATAYNITFLQNRGKGLQFALHTAIEFLKECKIKDKFLYCVQHDIYPIIVNPYQKLLETACFMKTHSLSLCGFHTLDYRQTRNEVRHFLKTGDANGMVGRRSLSEGEGGWIRTDVIRGNKRSYRYFEIEAPVDMSALINIDKIKDFFEPNEDFWLYMWLDDISNEIIKRGGIIIVDVEYVMFHCQELKRKYKIPVNSVDGAKRNDNRFREYGPHLLAWKNKWGYCRLTKRDRYAVIEDPENHKFEIILKREGVPVPFETSRQGFQNS